MVGFNSLGARPDGFTTASFGLVGGASVGEAVDRLTGSRVGILTNLADGYLDVAMGTGATGFNHLLGSGALSAGPIVVPPSAAMASYQPMCGSCYAGASRYTSSAMLGAFVGSQPGVSTVAGLLQGMDQAIMERLGNITGTGASMYGSGSLFQNPFMGMTATGLANVAGMQGIAGFGGGVTDNSGVYGGQGFGSWNPLAAPGQINNTNPYYESAHQAQAASLLADPSLTVEDKVTLLLMLIMNKMDDDIEAQAQYGNSIQQQQSATADEVSGGKGDLFGLTSTTSLTDDDDSPSIDVETMKLKRMVDKRSQMFDMLRQIIDKYNETAKGIIQSIGR